MRIGFDAKRAFHNKTGLGNYSRNLFLGLEQFFPEHDYLYFTPPIKDQSLLQWGKENIQKDKVITPSGLVSRVFPSLWRSVLLSSDMDSYKIDLFHGLSHELPYGAHKKKYKKVSFQFLKFV